MDRIGSNSKESVRLWRDSWFNLLYAIRKSTINTTQTYRELQKCPVTPQNPYGERFVDVMRPCNFNAIIHEIEEQTGLKPALDSATKDTQEE